MRDKGRPILVWIIFLVLMLLSAISLVSTLVIAADTLPAEVAQEIGHDRPRIIDTVADLLQTMVYIAAAITLFMMRKAAFYLFTVALFLEIGVFGWTIADKSRAEAIGAAGNDLYPYVAIITIGIAFLLFAYVLKLMMSERLA